MSSQRLDPKVIRYSQSSITGRFHQGRNICDVTSDFIADVYDRNEFIRCVRYPSEEYTSYDNKRLYWAREQPILSCTVCDADTGCFEDGRLAVLYWESENSKDNGSPKRLHKATVIARDYGAWIALKCSRQGPDFPLCGRLQLPTVSNRSISSELPLYRLCGTMKPITEESEIGNCIRDLQPHLAKKGSIYVGMPNGTLLYSNENWPAYLQGSGFENHFKCVMYETYLNIYIKTLGADKEKWDVADREAYDFEVQGLTELDDVSSEDSDDESWESEEEQRTLNNFGPDVQTKTAQEVDRDEERPGHGSHCPSLQSRLRHLAVDRDEERPGHGSQCPSLQSRLRHLAGLASPESPTYSSSLWDNEVLSEDKEVLRSPTEVSFDDYSASISMDEVEDGLERGQAAAEIAAGVEATFREMESAEHPSQLVVLGAGHRAALSPTSHHERQLGLQQVEQIPQLLLQ